MPTLDFTHVPGTRRSLPSVGGRGGVAVVQLNDDLWRVTRPEGDVLGYVERFSSPAGPRFRAKRFIARLRTFRPDGDFWAMDDAVACFSVG